MSNQQSLSSKIRSEHLERAAVVYLRQSSPGQVRKNLESQRLQYELVERARQLGWPKAEVIDADLGMSAGPASKTRPGFERVLAMVARREVGIVLALEASRLSRTDRDFCRLIEFCQISGVLIGDAEQVYDLDQLDDQLILGIKATMAAAEVRVMRARMQAAREAQAARGEYRMRLPAGYVYDADGRPVKDPDVRSREAIEILFQKFQEYRVARRVYLWMVDEKFELPVHQFVGGKLVRKWKVPTVVQVTCILKNPFYAGAYTYGRRPLERKIVDGVVAKRAGKLRQAKDAQVCLPNHHEAYVDWETFEATQKILADNQARVRGDERTAPKSGRGLLVGLIRCGLCGRKVNVLYWSTKGQPRYQCHGEFDAGGTYCQSFSGAGIESEIEKLVCAAISPLGVEASIEAENRMRAQGSESLHALERKLEQLTYEANRAHEQYDAVDPKNRLVAAELERRWNSAIERRLQAQDELHKRAESRRELDREVVDRIRELGRDFTCVWNEADPMTRKQIVRELVVEVVVTRDEKELTWVVHWVGGKHTKGSLARSKRNARKTSDEAIEIIRTLAPKYDDDLIAAVLNRNGIPTGAGKRWTAGRVLTARRRNDIGNQIAGSLDGLLNLKQATKKYQVCNRTIQRLVAAGLVRNEQKVPLAPLEIRADDLESPNVQRLLEKVRRGGPLELPREGDVATRQTSLF